ncbi:DEAD/DEAH box helicase [Flavobacteriales bacterium]|jgi:ATP-dependent RNA helicase RhlE|nr:DEAD/DEAH box helicase [Flavobacteriales bacterium]MDA7596183.1 DEAD/DEAH box helicase [Flavobacteriales bacterium]MDC0908616.1 DEAD/DEAH box helicase [Flavobacteriales bacterium]
MKFDDLKLHPFLLKAVKDEGYITPTKIQEKAIPHILNKKDILGSAQTGTGKTAAFALPILHHMIVDKNEPSFKRINVLVVTPTRELAIQIGENFTTYSKYTDINNTVIFGGVKQIKQTDKLKKGVDILIATPGRLLDLMSQGYISLKDISYFVLDEADRMLDMGFINDIKKIIDKLPRQRQSLFFSATMPNNILKLSNSILNYPEKVSVHQTSATADTIDQLIYYTNKSDKRALLTDILKNKVLSQVLIFSRTKHGADRLVKNLKKKNIAAVAIHGDKSQPQRQRALKSFKNKEVRVLVATDIAARGIDIDKLNFVINFDIPNEPETYVHRIGRCGRAGEKGQSISICEPEENIYAKDIEKLIKSSLTEIKNHKFPQTDLPMNPQQRKEFEKQKQKKKQEFFANRKKNKRTK